MALTKKDIMDMLVERKFLTNKEAHNAVEDLLEVIKSTLESGDDVMISNFGRFCIKEKAARKGRNPATEKKMILPPRKVVTFKYSGKLRDVLNQDDATKERELW